MSLTGGLDGSITFIDEQLEKIAMRIDNLRLAVKWKLCRYDIENMISFLEEYAKVQLPEEETHMCNHGYPLYLSHKEKHKRFTAQMHELREELLKIRPFGYKGSYELSVRTIQAVIDWLNEHIMQDDSRLSEFMRKNRHNKNEREDR